jgi:hypothetical protein
MVALAHTIDHLIEEQVRNGQYSEFNDEFMTSLLTQAKTQHSV